MGRRKTKEEFIKEAIKKHGNKYDYNKVVYTTSRTKVVIICTEHGEFVQIPNNHIKGKGCPDCSGNKKKNTESFIQDSIKKHGDKYFYDKTIYINTETKVIITCPLHGDFEQKANNHLNGKGCPICGGSKQSNTQTFIQKAVSKYGDKYNYDSVLYKNNKTKVIITCNEHGDFEQIPAMHLSGRGCPKCAESGYKSSKAANLYIQEVYNLSELCGYKIGITNNEPIIRLRQIQSKSSLEHKLIDSFSSNDGEFIRNIEQLIHKECEHTDLSEFIQDGWTEIIAVYEIDKAYSIINESMKKLIHIK